jgi:phage recombination protein Bet
MSTNEIAVASSVGALALDPHQTEWTEPQRAALSQLGIADAPHGDQLVFLHYAQRTGLDPFARQIYMIGRKEWDSKTRSESYKYTIQAGIDGLRVIAERSERYEGRTPISWCGADGVWRDVWLDKNTPPTAARVGVYKKGFREPLVSVAVFSEYAGTKKGGELTRMWATKGSHMIGKVAEALALRAAFPQDLAGVYIPEEMDQDEPKGEPGVGEAGETIATANAAQVAMYQPASEQMITAAQKAEIAGRVRDLGLGRDAGLALYAEATGREVPTTNLLTAAEADKVLSALAERAHPSSEIADAEVVAEPTDDEEQALFYEHEEASR